MYHLRLRLLAISSWCYPLVNSKASYSSQKGESWHRFELPCAVRKLVVLHGVELVPCFQYLINDSYPSLVHKVAIP